MRIKSLSLTNYRQFKSINLNFPIKEKNELYVFVGKNGTGKTNILNAINWCLYNDEPHLSRDSEGLPILNNLAYQEAIEDKPVGVKVELTMENESGFPTIFSREKTFLIKNNKEITDSHRFKIAQKDQKLNDKIIDNDDETKKFVERTIPKNIREYFFFDGERLDNYFKISGEIIKPAIMNISKINYLFSMRTRIETVARDFRREAGKVSTTINTLIAKLEKEEETLQHLGYQLEEANSQYEIAKQEIQRINEELAKFPNVKELESNRIRLEKEVQENAELLEGRKKDKLNNLYKQYILLNSYSATANTLQIIDKMRKNGEIPPFTDKEKLNSVLKEDFCNICGRDLDSGARQWINDIIEKIPVSSKIAIELSNFENPIKRMNNDIEDTHESIFDISRDIVYYEDHIKELDIELNEIHLMMQNYDIERIQNLENERSGFVRTRDIQLERIGSLGNAIDTQQKGIKKLKDDIEKEAKKNERAEIYMKKVDFCNEAMNVLSITIDKRLEEIKNKIQEETNSIFFSLIWKKATFNEIIIDENYQVQITSASTNLPMLGCLSKAENELLALSFTLALHKVSGFDVPLLIDTPVARVSDEQRVNFGRTLAQISKNRQIFLLFTPAEYSSDIKTVIEPELTNKFELEMSSDENQTMLKVIQ